MTFEGVGAGGGGMCDFRKNILQTDFHQKNIARRYLSYNGFVCQEKKNYHQRFGKKNSYANQITHTPPQKSTGGPLTLIILKRVLR